MRQLKSEYPFQYIHSTLSEKYTKKIRTAKPAFGFLESPLFASAPIYKTLRFFVGSDFLPFPIFCPSAAGHFDTSGQFPAAGQSAAFGEAL